jgi:hypothetical protein
VAGGGAGDAFNDHLDMEMRSGAALLAIGAMFSGSARACDDLVGNVLASYVRPAIQSLGCSALGKAGIDVAEHKLESLCYSSNGPTSTIEIVANLNCRTSDRAVIPFSLSERVTADAQVRGADCSVQNARLRPAGEIGKILASQLDADGRARKALQEGLNKICGLKLF